MKPSALHALILGGARSGKSAYAERWALSMNRPVTVVVTADTAQSADDPEMAKRIAHHQSLRPSSWRTVVSPLNLAGAINEHAHIDHCLLIDCLTLWLSNHLLALNSTTTGTIDIAAFEREKIRLLCAIKATACPLIMISNEVGLGIVPMSPVSRAFRDEAGRLHQEVAALCTHVTFVAAGLPLILKSPT